MTAAELARRALAYAAAVGAPLAVLSPLCGDAEDSFPISTYPMFARARGQPTLYTMVAVTADGRRERLAPEFVGTSEVLQAKVLIQRSVAAGLDAMAQLCKETAARVAARPDLARVRSLAIVERRYDPISYFEKGPEPLAETIAFNCDVDSSASSREQTSTTHD